MREVLIPVGMVAAVFVFRAVHYRLIFGRFVFRLRSEERRHLLPQDPKAAYVRGFADGKRAAREEDR